MGCGLQPSWKMTRNQELNVIHVNNASTFVDTVDTHIITGDTLIFDFIFFLHPVRVGPGKVEGAAMAKMALVAPSWAEPRGR